MNKILWSTHQNVILTNQSNNKRSREKKSKTFLSVLSKRIIVNFWIGDKLMFWLIYCCRWVSSNVKGALIYKYEAATLICTLVI